MAYKKAKIEASKKQSEPQEPKTFNVSNKDEIERERMFERMLLKEKCAGLFKNAKETRRRYDWEWLARDLYRRGYQFSRYNPSNRTVVLASRGTVKIPINLVWAQMRVIKNQVTNFQPKWEVLPAGKSEQAKANSRYSGKLLDYYYRHLGLRRLIKESVIQGLTYSVGGPWQIGYDPNADNGLGEVYIWGLDPYDFYIDPYASSPEEATFQAKAVRKPLDEVRANPKYKFPDIEIKGDLKLAESEYKQFLLQALKNQNFYSPETTEGVILKEFWLKRFVTEKNMEKIKLELEESEQDSKNLRSGETVMQVVTYLDSVIEPLKVQTLRRNDFPFVLYMADLNPREVYGESWLKHVIPMNRVLNGLESSVFQYNYKYAKGRIVMDKNSGVRMVSNQHGDFIEKNRGAEVTSLPLQPLPTSYQMQIENMRRYIEDIGGAHDVCVSDDTEALTKKGWKRGSELKIGDSIYTINPQTRRGEWNKIKKLYVYEKNGEDLYKIENKNLSALVTGNHRWFVRTRKCNGKRGNYIKSWEFRKTRDLNCNQEIVLSAPYQFPTTKTYEDYFVELVGWTITEGTYSRGPVSEAKRKLRIRICQAAKHKHECGLIENCLRQLNCFTKPQLQKDGTYQFAYSKEPAKLMRLLFPEKKLTFSFIDKLTEQQANILYQTLLLGDGSEISAKTLYYSVDKENIDAFQYLCSLLGFNSRVSKVKRPLKISQIIRGKKLFKTLYRVSVKDQTRYSGFGSKERFNKFIKRVKYTGLVWCPETQNGTWLMRKDGKVCFTGNSLGRLPTGVKSGVGIAELKQADSTNQSDLVDALEEFLIQVGEKLLKEIAENYEVPKIVKDLGLGGKVEHFAVVGEKAGTKRRDRREVRIGADVFPLAVIGKQNEIRVTVGSWLAYTKSAQQDKLKELYKDGLIDQKTALEHLEFSDVENIIEQTRQEELLKKFRGNPAAGQSQISDEEIAEQENLMMVNEGREVPVEATDNHAVHQAIHQEYAENPLVDRHLREHEALATTPASRMAPVGAPVPAPIASMPSQMAPMGSPAGLMESPSPEEAALQNSLQDIITTGGQNA